MKWVMIGAAGVFGVLLLAGIAAWAVGRTLPAEHTAQGSRDIAAPLERVAAIVRDVPSQPQWRPGVTRIEVLSRNVAEGDTVLRYVEYGPNGAIPFAFREVVPDHRFTSTIDTDTLAFGGRWTIELTARGDDRTQVTITEQGIVRAPLFRTMARYVFGHTRTIEGYLDALAAR